MIALTVNGKRSQVDAPADMPLLWVIREKLTLTGTKFGCGAALCGACTVHVDGEPARACVLPLSALAGKKITTIEGVGATPPAVLPDPRPDPPVPPGPGPASATAEPPSLPPSSG